MPPSRNNNNISVFKSTQPKAPIPISFIDQIKLKTETTPKEKKAKESSSILEKLSGVLKPPPIKFKNDSEQSDDMQSLSVSDENS